MTKKAGKKRNKVDPIILMAERNREASITAANHEKNQKIIKNENIPSKRLHNWQNSEDPFIADLDADRLFKEMKRRDF